MKAAIQIVLWLLCIFFVYKIYQSINQPIQFEKVKKERYSAVIAKLKDIRDSQEAHRSITGKFVGTFDKLISFIDTADFVITQQRDSSYLEYDPVYRIDMLKEVVIIDTLGFVKVKDSLFKGSDRYKTMMNVPYAKNNEKFALKADIIEKSGYKAAVFEAKVAKSVILHDQPRYLVAQENEMISIDEVNGPEIIVGSLSEVSTSGNWPDIYDARENK
ncbi:hypothetical protein [Leptobacterium sp. I13]|uniref:hypothetical protein n=1 Tax=Leptobacterium meishanense TaxID=3128904 RepID=UPI0030ED2EBB